MQSTARQSRRLRQIVGELLDIARLREGHLELRRERTDPLALVQGVVAEVQTMLDGRHAIALLVSPEPVLGYWDAGRLCSRG